MNELISIYPYKKEGQWVFDDEKAGLVEEPFVAGADIVMEMLSQTIPDGDNGFLLTFSSKPFVGSMTQFDWRREEYEGNWYYSPMLNIEGWLCPALLRYFESLPETIYASWHSKDYISHSEHDDEDEIEEFKPEAHPYTHPIRDIGTSGRVKEKK